MLDESEWEKIHELWVKAFSWKGPIEERFQPMKDLYFDLTGFRETNQIAIIHHRISQYGEPCRQCGKPLRTPEAAFCAACGWALES
jgi:hypothetical protein